MDTDQRQDDACGVSIVCVYNDERVREECLDRSIADYTGALSIDYVPVDNREHQFPTAGAALNHGAAAARHELVVFVHQDVYLHSIDRLVDAGSVLLDGSWALLGACGVTSDGEVVGLVRDRAELIGRSTHSPIDVETLDEVLFMLPRQALLNEPLTQSPDLAWHAYAVEYAVRLRAAGRRVGALDLAITHNSLTINLDRLDVAHRVVGSMYPDQLPIHTTCGTVQGRSRIAWKDIPILRTHRWRARWLRGSLAARRLSSKAPMTVTLSDIRHDIDLLSFDDVGPLHVLNFDVNGKFGRYSHGWLRMTRRGKPVEFACFRDDAELDALMTTLAPNASVLITGLDEGGVVRLCLRSRADWIIGVPEGPKWALSGDVLKSLPDEWSKQVAVPLGSKHKR